MDWVTANKLAEQHGDGFFVFNQNRFIENFKDLQAAFETHYAPTCIGYSYKTNYTPHLCRIVHDLGGYAEVVSSMEFALARRLGVSGDRIIFNGPCKGHIEFDEAASLGVTLNLDSAADVALATQFVQNNNAKDGLAVVLRCNFALRGDEISRFGMDVKGDEFRQAITNIQTTEGLEIQGLHCHFPDRDLESFGLRAEKLVALAKELFPETPPKVLNIGGGYFSHMPEALRQSFAVRPATFSDYGARVGQIFADAYPDPQKRPTLFLEPGTAVVADTFSFFTRVLSTRTIRGRHIATVAGSMFDISPTARSRSLPASVIARSSQIKTGEVVPYDITGFTCIEKDILTESLMGPIAPGDFIRYDNVGSYSVVMRPPFILPARGIFVANEQDGFDVIKQPQSVDDVFTNFEI